MRRIAKATTSGGLFTVRAISTAQLSLPATPPQPAAIHLGAWWSPPPSGQYLFISRNADHGLGYSNDLEIGVLELLQCSDRNQASNALFRNQAYCLLTRYRPRHARGMLLNAGRMGEEKIAF